MSNWVRLWEDMPTDPKWRVVAKRSGRPVSEVVAVFVFMMTSAGSSSKRGEIVSWDSEAVGVALDMETEHIEAIREAMQGRVLSGNLLLAWSKIRNPEFRDRPSTDEWASIRFMVFQRDNFTCRYCGERGGKLECDHVFPVSRGGGHEPENLVAACVRCNRSKGAKTLADWRQ